MSIKNATIIILSFAIILVSIFFVFHYVNKNNSIQNNYLPESPKNTEAIIDEKIEDKYNVLEAESGDGIYTQDEIDFILNPEKTIEKEMGIINEDDSAPKTKPLTQEEIDSILNPKK